MVMDWNTFWSMLCKQLIFLAILAFLARNWNPFSHSREKWKVREIYHPSHIPSLFVPSYNFRSLFAALCRVSSFFSILFVFIGFCILQSCLLVIDWVLFQAYFLKFWWIIFDNFVTLDRISSWFYCGLWHPSTFFSDTLRFLLHCGIEFFLQRKYYATRVVPWPCLFMLLV